MEERLQENYKALKKVLLADDDSDDRELFREAAGFVDPNVNIITANDGEELMTNLTRDNMTMPDLIFLDLNMPKKNGKECLSEIRSNSILKGIPVIIYTTSLNPIDIEDTFNSGALYFFRKPNSFEELKEVLHQVFTTG